MKRFLFLVLGMLLSVGFVAAQSPELLYKNKFSYDLKQNRLSVNFEGTVFWLRMSVLKNDTLTLTYLKAGDTPTTATEFVAFILLSPAETVDGYTEKLIASTRAYLPGPPDITNFTNIPGRQQRIISSLIKDPSNNLLEDDIALLMKLEGQRLRVAVHTKRIKLTEAEANPDSATAAIGDRRAQWMLDMSKVTFPF